MKREIQQFLDGDRQYAEACRLYLLYGKNRMIKRHAVPEKEKQMHHKLCYELGLLIDRDIIIEEDPAYALEPSKEIPQEEVQLEAPVPETRRELPEFHLQAPTIPVDELAVEKSRLHGQRAKLSNSLRSFPLGDDKGRAEVVRQIQESTKAMNRIRKQQEGIEEPVTEPVATPIGDLKQSLLNARSNLSKARTKLANADLGTTKWQFARDKVNQLSAEVKSIEDQLKCK